MNSAKYTLRLPDVKGCEVKYYYSKNRDPLEARTFPPHIHDVPEMYILAEGTACFAVENRMYRLTPGDVIVSRANELHNCVLTEKTVHKHLCFWFDPAFAPLNPILEACSREGNLITPTAEIREEILGLCNEINRATEEKKHSREYALLCLLISRLEESVGDTGNLLSEEPDLLSEILRDINLNFAEIESLDYFTERYYVSQSTLGRMFRTRLHTSPHQYIETKKLAHSRILLRKGRSVSEACAEAGFADTSGYIRLFRKRFGITPGAYKKLK